MNDANNVLIAKNNSVFLKGAANIIKPRLVTSAKQRKIFTTSDAIPIELHYYSHLDRTEVKVRSRLHIIVPIDRERQGNLKLRTIMETKLYQEGLCILCNSMLCCKAFGRTTFFYPSIPSPGDGDNLTLPHPAA